MEKLLCTSVVVSHILFYGKQVKPLDHSHDLPPPGKKGRTYICSCMIYMRPTDGAKLVMKKWIEELQAQPWSKAKKANDQPAFNWALNKTAGQVCSMSSLYLRLMYLLKVKCSNLQFFLYGACDSFYDLN